MSIKLGQKVEFTVLSGVNDLKTNPSKPTTLSAFNVVAGGCGDIVQFSYAKAANKTPIELNPAVMQNLNSAAQGQFLTYLSQTNPPSGPGTLAIIKNQFTGLNKNKKPETPSLCVAEKY